MASDSRSHSGSPHPIGSREKIHRHRLGGLFGIAAGKHGDSTVVRNQIQEMDLTYIEGLCLSMPFGGQVLVVRPDGKVFYLHNGNSFVGPLDADFYTIGTGAAYAHGALAAGASPERAIEIACEFDVYSAGPVNTLTLNGD